MPTAKQSRTVLQEADELINGDRRTDYGPPKESFTKVAQLWEPVLGCKVTPEQVALCMIQLKIVRTLNGYHRDSVVDIGGYAGLLELIHEEPVVGFWKRLYRRVVGR